MKITITDGENPQRKYISLGSEKAISITDHSDVEEMPYHHLEWKADIKLDGAVGLIRKLFDEARYYQCPNQDLVAEGPLYRIVTLGRTPITDQLRLYPMDDFWRHENPISQVQKDDVCIGLLTPHFALHFFNNPIRWEQTHDPEEAALGVEGTMLKYVHAGTLHDNINYAQISAYSNISGTIAELIAKTAPTFAKQQGFAKVILTLKLDQLLAQYKKPVKVN